MSEYIEKIQGLEKKIKDNELEQAKLSEREKGLKEEKAELDKELVALNISAKDLDDTIEQLEADIQGDIEQIEEALS